MHLGRIVHEKVHMVLFDIELLQFSVESAHTSRTTSSHLVSMVSVKVPRRYLVTNTKWT